MTSGADNNTMNSHVANSTSNINGSISYNSQTNTIADPTTNSNDVLSLFSKISQLVQSNTAALPALHLFVDRFEDSELLPCANCHPNIPQPPLFDAAEGPSTVTIYSAKFIEHVFIKEDEFKKKIASLPPNFVLDRKRGDSSDEVMDQVQSAQFKKYFTEKIPDNNDLVGELVVLAGDFRKELRKQCTVRLRAAVYRTFNDICNEVRKVMVQNMFTCPPWLEGGSVSNWESWLQYLEDTWSDLKAPVTLTTKKHELKLLCLIVIDTLHQCFYSSGLSDTIYRQVKLFMNFDDCVGDSCARSSDVEDHTALPARGRGRPKGQINKTFTEKIISTLFSQARTKVLSRVGVSQVKGQTKLVLTLETGQGSYFSYDLPTVKKMAQTVLGYVTEFIACSQAPDASITNNIDSGRLLSTAASPLVLRDGLPDDFSLTVPGQDDDADDDFYCALNTSVVGDNSGDTASPATLLLMETPAEAGPETSLHDEQEDDSEDNAASRSTFSAGDKSGDTASPATLLPKDPPADSGPTISLHEQEDDPEDNAASHSTSSAGGTTSAAEQRQYQQALVNTDANCASNTFVGGESNSGDTASLFASPSSGETTNHDHLNKTTGPAVERTSHTMSYRPYESQDVSGKLVCALCDSEEGPHYGTMNSTLLHVLCLQCAYAMKCTHTDPDSYTAHGVRASFMKPGNIKQCSACGLKKKMTPKSPFYYCDHCQWHRVCSTCYAKGDLLVPPSDKDVTSTGNTDTPKTSADDRYAPNCNQPCSHDNYDTSVSYEEITTWKYSWNPGNVARCCSECTSKSISRSLPMFVCKHCCNRDSRHILCSACWNKAILSTSEKGDKKRRRAFLNNKRAWNEI